jgi:hypothetical protein
MWIMLMHKMAPAAVTGQWLDAASSITGGDVCQAAILRPCGDALERSILEVGRLEGEAGKGSRKMHHMLARSAGHFQYKPGGGRTPRSTSRMASRLRGCGYSRR